MRSILVEPVLLLIFLILVPPFVMGQSGSSIFIENPRIDPSDPVTGEETRISYYLILNSTCIPNGSRLRVGEEIYPAVFNESAFDPENENVLFFEASLTPQTSGKLKVLIEIEMNGTWNGAGSFILDVEEKAASDEDTILGFPKWYCSISIILVTLAVIFFTWSYFKGRSMQKAKGNDAAAGMVFCSSCGKPVKKDDIICPWCKTTLDDEEFICGKCKKPVSSSDRKCPHCGAVLADPYDNAVQEIPSVRKKKPLSKTIEISPSKKRKCPECGNILLDDETKCPLCGYE